MRVLRLPQRKSTVHLRNKEHVDSGYGYAGTAWETAPSRHPYRHRETILDLTDDECAALMVEVRNAATAIDAAYQRPGISVWQNNGEAASQSIRHVHFHVAGTLDSGGTEWGPVEELPLAKTELIAKQVRAHWPSS